MTDNKSERPNATEAAEIAEQAGVECAVLLGIEKALRIAIQWKTRHAKSIHRLSTLRFHLWTFERHLTRIVALADHGDYLHTITDASPHLAREVKDSRNAMQELRVELERLIVRLDYVVPNDDAEVTRICADLERLLDNLRTHAQHEGTLLQHSFAQDEGGEG